MYFRFPNLRPAVKKKYLYLNMDILSATHSGNLIRVQELIASGVNVNAARDDGKTPLLIASYKGHTEIANFLLAAGANVNAALNSDSGKTPLFFAVWRGHTEIVNALIAAGANVNAALITGDTPLFIASENGNIEIVNALLAAGANVNAARDTGETPLFIASENGNIEIVNALIATGVDINMPSWQGKSVLQHAREGRFSSVIKSLIVGSMHESNLETVKWKGFTKSDIKRLDTIFDTDAAPGMRPNAENWSMCPVCLKFAERTSGCKYMNHDCSTEGGYKHNALYNKYKNDSGKIFWCTICNRICSGHRHYRIQPWDTTIPELVPIQTGVNFFSADCTGNEGGGGLLEKLVRFRRFKQYARELQAEVEKISFSDAMDQLVEEMWNAPLARFRGAKNMMNLKKFNVPNNNFLANVSVATNNTTNAPNLMRPNSNTLRPIVKTIGVNADAENSVGYAEEGRVIYFIHKKPDGAVVNHETIGEGIGESSVQDLIRDYNINFGSGNFGKCPFECGALLFPDEVRDIITAEDYEKYRKHFNKKFRAAAGAGAAGAGAAGGARIGKYRRTRKQKGGDGKNILVEAKFTQCSIVGGRRKTRRTMKSRIVLKHNK